MIVTMQRVRIIGPRAKLARSVHVLQDLGTLHPVRPEFEPPLGARRESHREQRHAVTLRNALEDIDTAMARLGISADRVDGRPWVRAEPLPREVRLARRARRAALRITGEIRADEEQRAHLVHLLREMEVFARLEAGVGAAGRHTAFLVLTRGHASALERLESEIADALDDDFVIHTEPVPGGELAVMLEVAERDAEGLAAVLASVGIDEIDLRALGGRSGPRAAADELERRLRAVDARLETLAERRQQLAAWLEPGLLRARAAIHDELIASEALTRVGVTPHLFVLEGWLPADERDGLARRLETRIGPELVVEDVARERWTSPDAPVSIHNPPMLRPFEVITRRLPTPRYGTLDPTPFVAVFFPLFFGLILGDVGYGSMLGLLAAVGWRRSRPGSTLRSVSQIAAACSIFAILFGLFFGELFGDLGHRLFGMHAVTFSREDAVIPFLVLAVSIGFVHIVLGLVLGAISGIRTGVRKSIGKGITALMLVLTAAILLAAVNVLPQFFLKPSVIGLLLALPVLLIVEGFVGAVELLSRVSNILSYARIMALGTASVMLAVVANEMAGAVGGAAVGVVFAALFHLVNFGLGVFSPTIHALRLHFVEFFGTFYSPGDQVYEPLRHWRPSDEGTPQTA